MRLRSPNEHDYEHYLDAVLKEYCGMCTKWQPELRNQVDPKYRSAYLDTLESLPGRANLTFTMDPNYQMFARVDRPDRLEVIEKYSALKISEMECYLSKSGLTELELKKKGTPSISVIEGMALRAGFIPVGKLFGNETLEFALSVGNVSQLKMQVDVGKDFRKHGSTSVSYSFSELPDHSFGLGSFLVAGHKYFEAIGGSKETLFNLAVHFRFGQSLSFEMQKFNEN